jgi:hypothetical protein
MAELADNEQTNLEHSVDDDADKGNAVFTCMRKGYRHREHSLKVVVNSILINQLLEFTTPFC